jgi:hypothetical protein
MYLSFLDLSFNVLIGYSSFRSHSRSLRDGIMVIIHFKMTSDCTTPGPLLQPSQQENWAHIGLSRVVKPSVPSV